MSRTEPILIAALAAALIAAGGPAYAGPAPRVSAPAQTALQSLVDSPHGALPPGTRLLGISLQNGLATVDFNRALTDNFRGGDSEAAATVNGILRTLGRFPTISKVQILEDGQMPGALGGLIVLSSPLPVIRPQSATQL